MLQKKAEELKAVQDGNAEIVKELETTKQRVKDLESFEDGKSGILASLTAEELEHTKHALRELHAFVQHWTVDLGKGSAKQCKAE